MEGGESLTAATGLGVALGVGVRVTPGVDVGVPPGDGVGVAMDDGVGDALMPMKRFKTLLVMICAAVLTRDVDGPQGLTKLSPHGQRMVPAANTQAPVGAW